MQVPVAAQLALVAPPVVVHLDHQFEEGLLAEKAFDVHPRLRTGLLERLAPVSDQDTPLARMRIREASSTNSSTTTSTE